jgi:hypothetical protein
MTVVIHGYLVFLDIFLPLNSLFLWFTNGKKKIDYALHSFQTRVARSAGLIFFFLN